MFALAWSILKFSYSVLDNVKALFRRAKAHVGAWNPDLARQDFHRVEELDPSLAKTVQKLLKDLDEKQKHKDAEDRAKLQGKMFGWQLSLDSVIDEYLYVVLV